jgi:dolichol-phosphate mannosyltransferase
MLQSENMSLNCSWALIVPMANEEETFGPFVDQVSKVLDELKSGTVYIVVDKASKDATLTLCQNLSSEDKRFVTIWAPENKNVVDAYYRGYLEALKNNHDYYIEMDAGLSHDPASIVNFLEYLNMGYDCVFGSRFVKGGSLKDSPLKRQILSRGGTFLSNLLLGTNLRDMTSGYQGFTKEVVEKITSYKLKSIAHFYQTEIRYLLRKRKFIEVPIQYIAPSPRVSSKAIKNSFSVLFYYFLKRVTFNSLSL